MSKFYITTAIPYVNAAPHIGHALEFVQTDVLARYRRLLGDKVYFLTGADENSLKNVQAAEKEGLPTKELVDKYTKTFADLKEPLGLSYDNFIRTTDPRHHAGCQKIWQACRPEDIYKKYYEGLYCVGCEAFLTPKDLVDGKCPEHNTEPQVVGEENYFFKLSNYQEQLADLIKTDKLKIVPQSRKNEVLSFINQGLEDFSISRSVARAKGWGIPVPGDDSQVMYVWFDALVNYLTGVGYGWDEKQCQKWWPADVHVIGKGITRFHAIYWPAMLLSAGLSLPKEILVHGYVTVDGQKISKSLGNVIDPVAISQKYGVEVLRYFLLREIPAVGDGDFSESKLQERYNADLANGLGNLVSRVTNLIQNNDISLRLAVEQNKALAEIDLDLENNSFDRILINIWRNLSEVDVKINNDKPWTMAKEGRKEELAKALNGYAEVILRAAYQLQPFMPETAQKISSGLTAAKVEKISNLFPRLS
jgi:methionyl-tRNA synthetase